MSREDPKPGRWILPLVVAGIIGFTYVFVNALPPAPVTETTLPPDAVTSTPAPTLPPTTTTIDPATTLFLADILEVETKGADLAARSTQINEDWDEGAATFTATRTAFTEYRDEVSAFADEVRDVIAPTAYATAWDDVEAAADDMAEASANMLTGFLDPDSAAGRRSAAEALQTAATALNDALSAVRAAVNA